MRGGGDLLRVRVRRARESAFRGPRVKGNAYKAVQALSGLVRAPLLRVLVHVISCGLANP